MPNLLSNIWNKISSFLKKSNSSGTTSNGPSDQRFFISGTVDSYNVQVSGKKFQIYNERNVPIRKEKFRVTNASRPQKCPRCNSAKTIIKSTYRNLKWECSEVKGGCSFKW